MPPENQPQKQNIQIKAKDEIIAGSYANMAQISHNKEEFILDFMSIFPPVGTLNNRVIMSPGHYKRLIRACQENLVKYESQFGAIQESTQPNSEFGWPTK